MEEKRKAKQRLGGNERSLYVWRKTEEGRRGRKEGRKERRKEGRKEGREEDQKKKRAIEKSLIF